MHRFSLSEILAFQWANRSAHNELSYRFSAYIVRSKQVPRA